MRQKLAILFIVLAFAFGSATSTKATYLDFLNLTTDGSNLILVYSAPLNWTPPVEAKVCSYDDNCYSIDLQWSGTCNAESCTHKTMLPVEANDAYMIYVGGSSTVLSCSVYAKQKGWRVFDSDLIKAFENPQNGSRVYLPLIMK